MSRQAPIDRRQHVRVRPTTDYVVEVALLKGIVVERATVVDVSVAGLGLLLEPDAERPVLGESVTLRIALGGAEPFEVAASVRHVTQSTGIWGVEIDRGNAVAMRELSRAVSELLERASV